jgi:hypothetical protein
LASKVGRSNGPDAIDVAEAIRAFEHEHSGMVVITLRPCRSLANPDIWLEGKLLAQMDVNGVRSLLAFASVKCLGSRHKSLDAATLALLYALDFQLANNVWLETGIKKA